MAEAISTELIVAEQINAVEIFTGPKGVEPILAELEAKVRAFVPDLSTAKSRKEIASMAYKVSLSKTLLDGLGEKLTLDWKAKSKMVDIARKTARDRLDALRDKTREPLTLWEEAEEKRLAAEKLAQEIETAHAAALAENDLYNRAKELEAREVELARVEAERVAKIEAERAEQFAKEEAAHAEAARKENEARIAREAAERATKEAEEAAAAKVAEANRKAAEAQAAVEKAEQEKKAAETARVKAAAQVERDKKAAEEKANADKAAAVAAAEEHARQEAIRIENWRISVERAEAAKALVEKAEAERKAADVEHHRSVNKEAIAGLVAAGLTDELAKAVITAIVGGLVKNVAITY